MHLLFKLHQLLKYEDSTLSSRKELKQSIREFSVNKKWKMTTKNLYHISFHFTCIFDKLWYLRMVEALWLCNTVCHGCKVLSLS